MDRLMERHPLSALWGDVPSDELVAMRENVQDHRFTDPVIWTYDGAVLDGWHRYTIANLLDLDLDVRVYRGDPVQWVIGRNAHRRHLTELQRASCGNAAREWQGHQQAMHTERDKDTGQFTDRGQVVPSGETDSPSLIQPDAGQSEQEPFFTQSERKTLADVSNLLLAASRGPGPTYSEYVAEAGWHRPNAPGRRSQIGNRCRFAR